MPGLSADHTSPCSKCLLCFWSCFVRYWVVTANVGDGSSPGHGERGGFKLVTFPIFVAEDSFWVRAGHTCDGQFRIVNVINWNLFDKGVINIVVDQ